MIHNSGYGPHPAEPVGSKFPISMHNHLPFPPSNQAVLVEGGIMPSPCWVKRSSALHVGNIFGETDGFSHVYTMYDCQPMNLMNSTYPPGNESISHLGKRKKILDSKSAKQTVRGYVIVPRRVNIDVSNAYGIWETPSLAAITDPTTTPRG